MNKRGVALILISILLVVLTIFSTALISSSFSENAFALRYLESTQAFWLAEAGINQALNGLRADPSLPAINGTLGQGGYNVTINATVANQSYNVTSQGFIPINPPFRVSRFIQAEMNLTTIPDNFYNTVIWSENDININGAGKGNWVSVIGDVISGGGIYTTPKNSSSYSITGNISINDTTAASLPLLDFAQLRYISQGQGNYHNATSLSGPFPTSFWCNNTTIPNVVFLEGDLALSGGDNVGGFFIVGGDSIYTTKLTGTVQIAGCIYTPGPIIIRGDLNIDGGIWAGSVLLNGNMTLSYNQTYMQGIGNRSYDTIIQITSWRDLNNTYKLD